MSLTRRQFLQVSSAGLLSLAAFPVKAATATSPLALDTLDLQSLHAPRILVMGLGGAGGAVVNQIMKHRLPDVVHVCVDTDPQALDSYDSDLKIAIGQQTKHGFCYPGLDFGRRAVEASRDEIQGTLETADLVLLVGGMGGATATGGIPLIAQIAHEAGALTVSVVLHPFEFEGRQRVRQAAAGISELEQCDVTTIVVPINRIRDVVIPDTTLRHAYEQTDRMIGEAAGSIINSIMVPGFINVTFSDVRTVFLDNGLGAMGIGTASGPNRAAEAAQAALRCPLLNKTNISGGGRALANIAGVDLKLREIQVIMDVITQSLHDDAVVCFCDTPNPNLQDAVRVTLIGIAI